VTLQKPHPAVPTLRVAVAAGNTSDMDVDRQLLIEWAGCNSLADIPLPDVPFPDVALPNVPVPEVRPDGSVAKECTRDRVAEEEMFVAFCVGLGSCVVRLPSSNLFISGINYYMR